MNVRNRERERWKEQQAGDSRGALEKVSFIHQREEGRVGGGVE